MNERERRSLTHTAFVVLGAVSSTYSIITRIPAEHSLIIVLLGFGLYWTAGATLFTLAGGALPYGSYLIPENPRLQLLLWSIAMVGLILATDFLTLFLFSPIPWIAHFVFFTYMFRRGLLALGRYALRR